MSKKHNILDGILKEVGLSTAGTKARIRWACLHPDKSELRKDQQKKLREYKQNFPDEWFINDFWFYLILIVGIVDLSFQFLPSYFNFILIGFAIFQLRWREGHRNGYNEGYDFGYSKGINDALSIDEAEEEEVLEHERVYLDPR